MRRSAGAIALRVWLLGTVATVTALAIWAYAPVLLFVFLLLAALGMLSAAIVAFAHLVRRWRERPRK
jgi:hypothetical protein